MDSLLRWALENIAVTWMLIGIALILIELGLGVVGIGFLFIGFAAITVGAFIIFGIIDSPHIVVHLIWLCALTAAWVAVLWYPLKKRRGRGHEVRHMIGDRAVVIGAGLNEEEIGKVRWSGTVMKARIQSGWEIKEIPAGTEVEIGDVMGTMLLVRPVTKPLTSNKEKEE